MASGSGVKVVVSAISGNAFITIIKFVGWFFTHSPSMLAEAVHSLADTLNQILLLIGLKHSEKESSQEHPTGHGKARYMWNLISAVGIFFLGFGVTAYHGIHSLMLGGNAPKVSYIALGVLAISFAIEFYVLMQAYKEVKVQMGERSFLDFFAESDDPTSVAVLLEDGVAVLGVLLAFIGIVLGQIFQSPVFDSITAIIIALLLGFLAIALGVVNGKLLLGRRVAQHKHDEIRKFIEQMPEVLRIENLQTKVLGAGQVRLSMEIEFHGEKLIDHKSIEKDVREIQAGADTYKTLYKSNERMVRIVGKVINDLEIKIYTQFPEIKVIDFEVG